ncbi:hypothetical protein SPI_05574 [Niveomyces insectorum RCEF 264]|uniref:NAD+ kinase n=1 Tax=Niveomyces insectorum RCEF 264 TaxID=1081102 RepID=A0A167TCC3_9HYPO|nr:hypothetical protein SPI_05574 [Niveomyces insectorum RCEF 264]
MPDPADKHVCFEDGNDGHSSTSDEDRNAVEVLFDPSNPYRRKSSLASADAVPPRLRRSISDPNKAQCIVHHLLDAQRLDDSQRHGYHYQQQQDCVEEDEDEDEDEDEAINAATAALATSVATGTHAEPALSDIPANADGHIVDKPNNNAPGRASRTQKPGHQLAMKDIKAQQPFLPESSPLAQEKPLAAAGARRRHNPIIVEPSTSDSEAGQVDEKEWTKVITKTPSNETTDHETVEVPVSAHVDHVDHVDPIDQIDHAAHAEPLKPADHGDRHDGHDRAKYGSRSSSSATGRSSSSIGGEALNSRLLTKKQLSEMAWGVRELSRRLGSLRLRFRVRHIFVLTKIYDQDLVPKTRELTKWLLSHERDVAYTVHVEQSLRGNKAFDAPGLLEELYRGYAAAGRVPAADEDKDDHDHDRNRQRQALAARLRYWEEDMCRTRPHAYDMVITLGGDGTVLYASWLFQRIVPPVLSFGLGSLGFLTKFDFDEYAGTLATAFAHGVTVSLRLRFEATIMRCHTSRQRRRRLQQQKAEELAAAAAEAGGAAHGGIGGGGGGDDNDEAREKPELKQPPLRIQRDSLTGETTVCLGQLMDGDETDDEQTDEDVANGGGGHGKGNRVRGRHDADYQDIHLDEATLRRGRDLVEELIGEEKDDEHTHRPDGTYEILNEVVIDRGPNPTMSYTEIFGDDEHFTSVLADGICVSTPTGSTAYNLAAGGSLCHPENPVMLVTAICAHTLSFRPIILPDTIVLRVGVPFDARTSSWASFDGRERLELKPGDYVTISASRYPFATVQAPGRRSEDWVNSISGKLGWNTRQKQKAYKPWQ